MVRILSYLIVTIIFIFSLLFSTLLLFSVVTSYFSIPAMIVQLIIAGSLILIVRYRRKKKKRVFFLWLPTVFHSLMFLFIFVLGLAFIFNLAEKEDAQKLKEATVRIGASVLKIDYFKKALIELEKNRPLESDINKKIVSDKEELKENTEVTFEIESNDKDSDKINNSKDKNKESKEKKSNVEDPEGLK